MTIESLNCPSCGAAVSSDQRVCRYCRAVLIVASSAHAGSNFASRGGYNTEPVKTLFDVILKSAGRAKLAAVKLVKDTTGLGLRESVQMVDQTPSVVKKGVSKAEAESLRMLFEKLGAVVEIV